MLIRNSPIASLVAGFLLVASIFPSALGQDEVSVSSPDPIAAPQVPAAPADSLDLHSGAASMAPEPASVPAPPPTTLSEGLGANLEELADELDPPKPEASATPAPANPPTGETAEKPNSRVSATLETPGAGASELKVATADPDTVASAAVADEKPSAVLMYISLAVGLLVLLLLGLVLVLSQQSRRGRRRKRRRKADLPLQQRMVAPGKRQEHADAAESEPEHPEPETSPGMAPPNRFGGGPRRHVSKGNGSGGGNGAPLTQRRPPTAEFTQKSNPRAEYTKEFEHLLRLSRLREGEPDAPLDRMTLSEMHMHYSALLRIVPAEARAALVESIETLMDELEDER